MAVDLLTGDTVLPFQFLLPDKEDDDDILSDSNKNNNNNNNNNYGSSALKSPLHSTHVQKDDDFINELTHHMAHFTLQDHDAFDFSRIGSQTQNFEPSWDLTGSPQSTLWSPMGYNQGSSEGSSQEPSPPPTPGNDQQDSCWNSTTYDVVGAFENMLKLNERGNSKYHPAGYEIQSSNSSSNIGLCSYQTLIQEQIRAIELSRLKQEQVLSPKQNHAVVYQKNQGKISQQYESKQEIQQFQKKGKGGGGISNGRRTTRPPRPTPLQTGSGMRAVFLGGSGSRGGTGVFLPRGGTCAPSESTSKKQGKGCSTVLIPARVVQALQLHFDKTAAMSSGPKVAGFPPLRDLVASDRDGMYSLQNHQSTKAPEDVKNEMILPLEWTY